MDLVSPYLTPFPTRLIAEIHLLLINIAESLGTLYQQGTGKVVMLEAQCLA